MRCTNTRMITVLSHIYTKHRQIILYGIIGSIGALLDLLLYILFYKALHIPPFIASFLSVSLAIANNFVLNNRYNFKKGDHTLLRFASFYITGCVGAILSAILIFILFDMLHIGPTLAKILTIIPVVLLQYFINKTVSFADDPYKLLKKISNLIRIYWLDICVIIIAASLFFSSIFYLVAADDMDNFLGGKLILEGQFPYKDFFSHHAPGMYFLSALIYPFTEANAFTYRLLFNGITFALAIALFTLLAKHFSRTTARAFILLFSFAHTIAFMHLPLGESLIAILIPITLLLIYGDKRNPYSRKRTIFISLLLFLVPFMSLAYIFPALVLYILYAITSAQNTRQNKVKVIGEISISYALPYILGGLIVLFSGSLADVKYDLLDFNSTYYAPMVGEQGGGVLKTLAAMLMNSVSQISLVGSNLFNPAFITQALLLLGIGIFAVMSWKEGRRTIACALPALLLTLSTRTNTFNPPAISSSLNQLAQHAALYLSVALLLGTVGSIYFLSRKGGFILKVASIMYLILVPLSVLNIWTNRMSDVFITKQSQNYYTYAKNIQDTNTATVINKFTTTSDHSWIAPFDFVSQIYLTPQRMSKYTFYLPWLNASPKITDDLISSLSKDHPKLIYVAPYQTSGANYSDKLTNYIEENFFTVPDPRLQYYYFNNIDKEKILEEIRNHDYKTN